MSDPVFEEFKPPPDCLLSFIDDTGDPACRDPVNPVFGLGGCAVMARDLDRLVRQPWASVRMGVGRSATPQLHAARSERRMTPTKEKAIRTFFIEQPIARVAYISSIRTQYTGLNGIDDMVVKSTAISLLNRIVDVAKWMPFSSIVVIFEENKHLTPRLQAALADFRFEENGRVTPHDWCVMPKSAGEPGLEVADFMMHTIAGYCRSGRDPQGKFAARFSAIFGTKDDRLVSFMEGESTQ
jgi:Protein of unknown function (DUF3800)